MDRIFIPSEVKSWAIGQFLTMRGNKNIKLDLTDLQAVREIAFSKFGYMFNVAEAVANAYRLASND